MLTGRLRIDVARLASAAVLAQLIPLLVLPWLTRTYEAADIGRWTFFAGLASTLSTVACLRLEYAILLPRRESTARALLQLCLLLSLGWVLFLLVALPLGQAWAWLGTADETLGALLSWLPWAVGVAGCVQALSLWLNRASRFADLGRARILAPAVTSGLQGLGGLNTGAWAAGAAGAPGLIGGQVFGAASGALWLAWQARAALRALRWRRLRARKRRFAALVLRYRKFPLVNAPHAFVNALQDAWALALVIAALGPVAAAWFGLVNRVLMAPVSLIGGAMSEVLLGRAAQMHREGQALNGLLRKTAWAMLALAVPIAVAVAWLGPAMFGLAFGASWQEAGEWGRWLAPYLVGRMVIGPLTVIPMVIERQATALAFSVVGNALYVSALWAGLHLTGDMRVACGVMSACMVCYFAAYGRWLLRVTRQQAAGGT